MKMCSLPDDGTEWLLGGGPGWENEVLERGRKELGEKLCRGGSGEYLFP